MGKGKQLTDCEQEKIKILKEHHYSNRRIAERIGRSEGVIRNFLKKGEKYGVKAPTKGNTKLTLRQKGQIRDKVTKNRLSYHPGKLRIN